VVCCNRAVATHGRVLPPIKRYVVSRAAPWGRIGCVSVLDIVHPGAGFASGLPATAGGRANKPKRAYVSSPNHWNRGWL